MLTPAAGSITQGFHAVASPGHPQHLAIDYGWGNGRAVRAAAAGVLSYDQTPGYGLRATINHGALITPTTVTRYAHLYTGTHPAGPIAAGAVIGQMGSSGSFASFVHLHFELLLNASVGLKKVDPTAYMTALAAEQTTPLPPPTPEDTDMKLVNSPLGFYSLYTANGFYVIGEQANADKVYRALNDLGSAADLNYLSSILYGPRWQWNATTGGWQPTLPSVLPTAPTAAPATPIDYAALAKAVNDDAAERMKA